MMRPAPFRLWTCGLLGIAVLGVRLLTSPSSVYAADDLHIEITKKGLGKDGRHHTGNARVVHAHRGNVGKFRGSAAGKKHGAYLVDESETHDRPMTTGEVDGAITDYVNSVKTRAKKE